MSGGLCWHGCLIKIPGQETVTCSTALQYEFAASALAFAKWTSRFNEFAPDCAKIGLNAAQAVLQRQISALRIVVRRDGVHLGFPEDVDRCLPFTWHLCCRAIAVKQPNVRFFEASFSWIAPRPYVTLCDVVLGLVRQCFVFAAVVAVHVVNIVEAQTIRGTDGPQFSRGKAGTHRIYHFAHARRSIVAVRVSPNPLPNKLPAGVRSLCSSPVNPLLRLSIEPTKESFMDLRVLDGNAKAQWTFRVVSDHG